jgi:hypothetical protein
MPFSEVSIHEIEDIGSVDSLLYSQKWRYKSYDGKEIKANIPSNNEKSRKKPFLLKYIPFRIYGIDSRGLSNKKIKPIIAGILLLSITS